MLSTISPIYLPSYLLNYILRPTVNHIQFNLGDYSNNVLFYKTALKNRINYSSKMLSKFEKYCIFHQLIGQAFLISSKLSRSLRLFRWIIFSLNIVFTVLCTKELFHHIGSQFKESNFFHGIFASATVVPILFAMLANIHSPNRIQSICDALIAVLKDLELKFNLTGVQRTFLKVYNKKIAWILFSVIILLISHGLILPKNVSRTIDIVYIVLDFQKDCLILQCVFYMDLIKLILKVLGVHMIKVTKNQKLNAHQKAHILSKLKWIHLSLWEIMKCINDHYGWTLITILFDAFINILRMIYLQFLYFHSPDRLLLHVTRKYLMIYLCYKMLVVR